MIDASGTSDAEFESVVKDLLCRELGKDGYARFLGLYRSGNLDYVEPTIEDSAELIRQSRRDAAEFERLSCLALCNSRGDMAAMEML